MMKKLLVLLWFIATASMAQTPSFKSFSHDEFGTNNFLISSFWKTNVTIGVANRYPVGLYLVTAIASDPLSVSNNGASRFIIGPVNTYDFNDVHYRFPLAQGSSGTVLSNDGSGNLFWAVPSTGGGGSGLTDTGTVFTYAMWIGTSNIGNGFAHSANSNLFEVYNFSTNQAVSISNRFYVYRNPANPINDFQCLEIRNNIGAANGGIAGPTLIHGLKQGGWNASLQFSGDNSLAKSVILDNGAQWYPTVNEGGNLGEATHAWLSVYCRSISFDGQGDVNSLPHNINGNGGYCLDFTSNGIEVHNASGTATTMRFGNNGMSFFGSSQGMNFQEIVGGQPSAGARQGHFQFQTNTIFQVTNTTITANTRIYLTYESRDGTIASIAEDRRFRTNASSFRVISSRPSDTNFFNYLLTEGF